VKSLPAQASLTDAEFLLRGAPGELATWTRSWTGWRTGWCVVMIIAGAGLYGLAMGIWRAPLQAFYVALKLPIILLLTAVGNSLINAMVAPLLGVNISLAQSFRAVLSSFAIAGVILGGFSPIAGFLAVASPPLGAEQSDRWMAYSVIMLSHVAAIAFAGIMANARLYGLLCELGGSTQAAPRVLFTWLTVNLLLGSQLSWNLRPFIGSPHLPVEFIRPNAFEGNFFEAVFRSFLRLFQ
jgi:hypothetical protein